MNDITTTASMSTSLTSPGSVATWEYSQEATQTKRIPIPNSPSFQALSRSFKP